MRSRWALLMLALWGMAPHPARADGVHELGQLGWMSGTWFGESRGVRMEETWGPAEHGAMLGTHKDTRAGRLVSFEWFRIVPSDSGRVVYLASPNGATPTAFRSVEMGDRRVVFENPGHDFPQRILYWVGEDGRLHARIEGRRGGRDAAMEWVWERRACD